MRGGGLLCFEKFSLCFFVFCELLAVFVFTIAVNAAPVYSVDLLQTLPHDRTTFTQGLFVDGDDLVESSGLYGASFVVRYPMGEGKPRVFTTLPKELFAEGITLHQGNLYLLTWREKTFLTLDFHTFKLRKKLRYPDQWGISEGWGLTSDGKQLILSDGTDRILFIDPGTLLRTRVLRVTDGNLPVRELNELEFAEGVLLANIWYQDKIAGIDPVSGRVIFWLDLSLLRLKLGKGADVANGIAWDAQRGMLYVTGKYWDKIFVIAPPSHIFPGEKR